MRYGFACRSCATETEICARITEEVEIPKCSKCKKQMSKVFYVPQVIFHCVVPGKAIKIDKEAKKIEEIQEEGWQSKSEMQEGYEMSRERAAKKKISEGRLTGQWNEKKKGKEQLKKEAEQQHKLHS